MQPNAWWRPTAVALALLAAGLPIAARALVGPRGATVHVRWQSSVTESMRQDLEARFRLADGERLDESTWRYDLIDPSSDNIRALVMEPAVADTHNIDRPNSAVEPSAGRTGRRQRFAAGGERAVRVCDGLALTIAAFAALLTLVRASGRMPSATRRRLRRMFRQLSSVTQRLATTAARFAQRGVPEIDAATAGIFRIVFGVATVAYFVSRPVDPSWLSATFDLEVDGPVHAWVLEWLRGRPVVVDLLQPWLLTLGVAFTIGLFTRLTYALFVAGALIWAYMVITNDSTHPHSAFILTLVALLPSRWGDACSVDAWIYRIGGRERLGRQATRQYGYSVWVPVLTLGGGLAAAAWAKLSDPPEWTAWILNGTVKYHFISDSVNAPVDWGLQLVRHPLLAILASFGAIATEALIVTAAFTRSDWYRLAMGLGGVALFAGIGLFMGVFWPGWWIPLLGFLPWQRMVRRFRPNSAAKAAAGFTVPVARRSLTATQWVLVAGIIAQQVLVSTLKLERAPMFTWQPMYSGTYASPAAFNASRSRSFRIVATTDRGQVELRCNPHDEFVRQFQSALDGSAEARVSVWHALSGCGENLADVRDVTLVGVMRTFDWDRLEFAARSAAALGPLRADTGEGPKAP